MVQTSYTTFFVLLNRISITDNLCFGWSCEVLALGRQTVLPSGHSQGLVTSQDFGKYVLISGKWYKDTYSGRLIGNCIIMAYQVVPIPVALNDPAGHVSCVKPL